MADKKSTLIKILGVTTTVLGLVVSLASDWVAEQKMNERIEEKVGEALARREQEESEES